MALSFTGPDGYRFFSVMVMISILILALVNSIVHLLPEGLELVRFSVVNIMGFLLYYVSIWLGKRYTNKKHVWFNNAFITSGIALILYANTVLSTAIHTYVLPIFYVVELISVFYLGNKMRHETDLDKFTELTDFETNI
jgi:hypothetical protein